MATLHVRNVPDELYDRLKRQAEIDNRSLSAEVIARLEQTAPRQTEEYQDLLERIDRRREELRRTMGTFPSSVALIREDRDR